ncbi:hypothetical protein V6U89_27290 [Micromonospora sp. CPCC 206171]|uniref:hypothetical protein n=1 Tax=Micromonospora sp. CPCC 206171 TaxID=3122405 RepID=UPI002FF361C2
MIHQPDDERTCAVEMSSRQWRSVNSVLDNVVNVEAENGDPDDLIAAGTQILREGWHQITGWTETTASTGWPHDDQEVTVALSGAQWRYVISCLDRWHEVTDEKSAAELSLIRELVVSQAEACLPGQL